MKTYNIPVTSVILASPIGQLCTSSRYPDSYTPGLGLPTDYGDGGDAV